MLSIWTHTTAPYLKGFVLALVLGFAIWAFIAAPMSMRAAPEPAEVLEPEAPREPLLIDEACARLSPADDIALCSTAR